MVLVNRFAGESLTVVSGPSSSTELRALNASPRIWKPTRSVTLNFFSIDKSRLGTVGLRTWLVLPAVVL